MVAAEGTGVEDLVQKAMPAYFRSQRQIIIDAEALLKEKPKLAQEKFVQRSDNIGVDQRLLRLRYGQFLGEESEGAAVYQRLSAEIPAVEFVGYDTLTTPAKARSLATSPDAATARFRACPMPVRRPTSGVTSIEG